LYGGRAFGGKTWALAYEAARYATVPGYAGIIFRRDTTQLVGGGSIWEETKKLYPHLGGTSRESPALDWRFPASAMIELRHLQYEHTVYHHQGKQYDFIGFDELTHFTAKQFWYMYSRLRSSARGIPKRMRGTLNPDPDSFVRELVDWWISKDGFAIEARSGIIRWVARLDERLVWGHSADEVWQHDPDRIRRRGEPMRDDDDARPEPTSFTFISAKASDNKIGLANDPGYLGRLAMLPGAERKRLAEGDWNAKDSAGDYFNRETFPIVDDMPAPINVLRRCRFWDKAATRPHEDNPDPDWTVGARVSELDNGEFLIEDRIARREGPAEVLKLIRATAELDGRQCIVGLWRDPGQSGVVDADVTLRELRGWPVEVIPATKNKEAYAKAWAPIAARRRVKVLRREYLPTMFGVLEAFPVGKHDDDVDALSGCFQVLTGGGMQVGYDGAADPRHPLDRVPSEGADDEDDDSSRDGGYF
jgi:predicted phage terminase large subunit-like protein